MAETLESSLIGEIDTSAPFESVREAATHFGGFGFWKPSSHKAAQNDINDESGMVELEKELIAKEGETLKVLKSLESTKSIVEELKSKLQRKEEEKENCDMSVLEELNQAKTNLCKTTEDLASIRESVKQLNKRLEDEQAALKKTRERLRHEAKELSETEESEIKTAEMRLVTARKMIEAAKAAETVAIAEIKDVTRRGGRRRRGNKEVRLQEEILESIEETSREIRRSRRTIEEGLEKVNTAQMERSSCSVKYNNPFNGLNLMMKDDETSSSVGAIKPTMSIGQILSRKLLLAEETGMMNRKVSLGQILGKTKNGGGSIQEKEKLNGKRKRFGFAKLSVMLNKEIKKNTNKKKKIDLNLKG